VRNGGKKKKNFPWWTQEKKENILKPDKPARRGKKESLRPSGRRGLKRMLLRNRGGVRPPRCVKKGGRKKKEGPRYETENTRRLLPQEKKFPPDLPRGGKKRSPSREKESRSTEEKTRRDRKTRRPHKKGHGGRVHGGPSHGGQRLQFRTREKKGKKKIKMVLTPLRGR